MEISDPRALLWHPETIRCTDNYFFMGRMHHDKALNHKQSDQNSGFKEFYTYPPTAEGQALGNDADAKYLHHSLVW